MPISERQRTIFLCSILFILFILIFFIFSPFLDSIIFSILLAAVLYPWHKYQVSIWGWKPSWSALLVTVVSLIVVLFPSIYITTTLIEILPSKIQAFRFHQTSGLPTFIDTFLFRIQSFILNNFDQKIDIFTIREKSIAIINSAANQAGQAINYFVSNFFHIFFTFILTHIILYSWLRNGRSFKNFFLKYSPLNLADNQVLIRTFIKLNNTLMKGNAISGTFQSLVSYILFKITGIEEGLLFCLLMFFASFVPVVGTAIVFLPISIYLWMLGNYVASLSVFFTCGLAFVFMENWFKPTFIGERLNIHPVLVLIGLLGGVKILGIVGLFYGPIIVGMFLCILNILQRRLI
ncbi:MAG: AI-2E family transporter [Bacteriovoracaceae bacterium]|nr:AI-2E family transporter [Bacteriovoracaceae bacterium]